MEIILTEQIPTTTGYYLCQCSKDCKAHLVFVVIKEGEKSQIINGDKPLFFNEFPNFFLWSPVLNIGR